MIYFCCRGIPAGCGESGHRNSPRGKYSLLPPFPSRQGRVLPHSPLRGDYFTKFPPHRGGSLRLHYACIFNLHTCIFITRVLLIMLNCMLSCWLVCSTIAGGGDAWDTCLYVFERERERALLCSWKNKTPCLKMKW